MVEGWMSKPNRKRCESKYTDEEMEKIFLVELSAAKIKCAKRNIKMSCIAFLSNTQGTGGTVIALPGVISGGSAGGAAVALPGVISGGSAGGVGGAAVALPGVISGGSSGGAVLLPGEISGGSAGGASGAAVALPGVIS